MVNQPNTDKTNDIVKIFICYNPLKYIAGENLTYTYKCIQKGLSGSYPKRTKWKLYEKHQVEVVQKELSGLNLSKFWADVHNICSHCINNKEN